MEEIGQKNGAFQTAGSSRWTLIILAVLLTAITVVGLIWLFAFSAGSPIGFGWFIFSFAAGLSMIVLPCTLPLAFVIVPLSLGKSARKGLSIALAFSLGVSLMLSVYGILAALVGEAAIGTLGAPLEVIKNWLYMIAGAFALVFALGELNLIRFRMPSYTGSAPAFIQKQSDYLKAFLLGLFLGNIGVGCPHPATPVILARIAVAGDVFYGWMLFFVHAVGRVIPLLILVLLALIGINALSWLTARKEKIEKASGWAMVFTAAFILVLGLFTHDWWVYSGQHSFFEFLMQEERFVSVIAERIGVKPPHTHTLPSGTGMFGLPFWLGNWVLVLLWIVPLFWYWKKQKSAAVIVDEAARNFRNSYLRLMFWFFLVLSLLLGMTFIYALPEWFINHKSKEVAAAEIPDIQARLNYPALVAGKEAKLVLELKDAEGKPLTDLKINHDRLVHFVIISEDLSYFKHTHAEDFGTIDEETLNKGEFVIFHNFPKAMRYLVAADFRHGKHDMVRQFIIEVAGPKTEINMTKNLERKKSFNDYEVSLTAPSRIAAGEETALVYHFEKDGKPVTDLEYYLAAPMHFSVVSADLSTFIHTHGEIHTTLTKSYESFGPEVEAHITFPYPGLYKVFGEFKHGGKVTVAEFMLEVGLAEKPVFTQPVHPVHDE